MFSYTVRRFLLMIPTLLLITAVVFAVVKLAPGNPFSIAQSSAEGSVKQMNPADYEALLQRYGLDKPWYVQYLKWLGNAARGSFGDSFSERRPVIEVFFGSPIGALSGEGGLTERIGNSFGELFHSRFGATVFLNLLSMIIMVVIALPVGFRAAVKRGGWFDRISSFILYMLYSLPNFWVAILLIMLVGVHWKLLPFIGMHSDGYESLGFWARLWDLLKHAALPAVCLAYGSLAFMARFTRGTLLEVIEQDYIRTARAKGLSERVVLYRHALRNALIPLLTLAGLMIPALVSGSIIIEQIFAWPGLGQLYLKAIYTRDYPLIMANALLGAVVVLISTLLTDLAYAFADPRVRYE